MLLCIQWINDGLFLLLMNIQNNHAENVIAGCIPLRCYTTRCLVPVFTLFVIHLSLRNPWVKNQVNKKRKIKSYATLLQQSNALILFRIISKHILSSISVIYTHCDVTMDQSRTVIDRKATLFTFLFFFLFPSPWSYSMPLNNSTIKRIFFEIFMPEIRRRKSIHHK